MTTTLVDIQDFITSQADSEDLSQILGAVKARRASLEIKAAAAVETGARVELHNLRPQYLNGLTGTVKETEGGRGQRRVTVTLDESSTSRLRIDGARRFYVPRDVTSYDLNRVPAACCKVLGDAS